MEEAYACCGNLDDEPEERRQGWRDSSRLGAYMSTVSSSAIGECGKPLLLAYIASSAIARRLP